MDLNDQISTSCKVTPCLKSHSAPKHLIISMIEVTIHQRMRLNLSRTPSMYRFIRSSKTLHQGRTT